jgi:predicted TIM-barrel fold metal-dependent hydrolase
MSRVATVIDSDQHLYEYRGMWREHIDPALRDDALELTDDARGHTWLTWRDRVLGVADVQEPGETDAIGERRRRERAGLPPLHRYDEALPRDYWEQRARLARLTELAVDEAFLFPNYGLGWERKLGQWSRPALLANLRAWNRWCASVAAAGGGRLHPVMHLHLGDFEWLRSELATAARAGLRLAMIAPALVDGVPLSHPSLDRAWSLLSEHGVTPVFHVADQPRPFHDAWYTDGELGGVPVLDSVFLWTPAALAATDLIVNGVFARHPELRLGIVELSAVWVPMYLMMLDGGMRFVNRLHGESRTALDGPGSEVFKRHVRVSSFAYELPERIIRQTGGSDLYMCCSDYPHSEGTATPVTDYRGALDAHRGLRSDNAAFLLGR